jgi:hypothetical protein
MAEPRIKRYALVQNAGPDGIRRFHLARVASGRGLRPREERLERMERIVEAERRDDGSAPR